MTVQKFPTFVLLFLLHWVPAQANNNQFPSQSTPQSRPQDDLSRHLSAAETYQLSGDLERAAIENRAVAAIVLGRLGVMAIREGRFHDASELLRDSLDLTDNPVVRTNLAIAYMRLREIDKAIIEVQAALKLDSKSGRAHHLLGKLLYMKGSYADALPELERSIVLESDLDAAYTLGMTYLRLKQLERARLLFEELLVALKNSVSAHLLFGRAYEETGFSAEAEQAFRKALAINDKAPRAHFYLGYVILQHGGSERLPEARKEFEREVQLDPDNVYANFFLGVLASIDNNHANAIRYLQVTTRLNPSFGEAYLFLGQSQAELGDAGAEKSLRRAIELTTDISHNNYQIKKAHFVLGRVLLKAGRRAEAENELTIARDLQAKGLESSRQNLTEILGQSVKSTNEITALSQITATSPNRPEDVKTTGDSKGEELLLIEESPLDTEQAAKHRNLKEKLAEILAQAFHNLGVSAAQQNQLPGSLQQFEKAARWKADLPGLDRNWGIVSFRAEQYDAAIPLLSRQVKAHPEDALTQRMLGVSYYMTKTFGQAVETLKSLGPGITADPELAYIYGTSLIQIGERKPAEKFFESLSALNPKSAAASFYSGQGFAMLEDYERALKEFRKAALLDPKMLQVHYHAGQSLIRLNRPEEAQREFRAELKLNSADVAAKYHLAYVLLEQKQETATALALLRETVAARPQYADARYQLGKTLIDQGEVNEAIEHLEIAARAEPSKDYIHYQLSIAYRRVSRNDDADRELRLYRELKAANRNREVPGKMGTKPNVP